MAIMFVLSVIGLFTLLMYSFKFDVKLDLIKAQNSSDKYQARLNAESGLHFALIRLELYANILNYVVQNPKVEQFIETSMINQVWSLPIKLPIELTEETSILDKGAIEKFQENFLMEGEVLIDISSFGNKLNLNLLRQSQFTQFLEEFEKRTNNTSSTTGTSQSSQQQSQQQQQQGQQQQVNPAKELEKRFRELLTNALMINEDKDEFFRSKYSGINIDELVASLQYYMSDKDQDIGPLTNQMVGEFQKMEITPKHAPMTSITELNLLPYWDDTLINLIKNEVTVHGNMVIDINKINANILRLLIPEITEENIALFFEFKNTSPEESEFESLNDLKNYFVNEQRIDGDEFDQRAKILEQSGITFGVKPELFKVSIEGSYNNSKYNLNAIVEIPRKDIKANPNQNGSQIGNNQQQQNQNTQTNQSKQKKFEYTKPRVLEIFVN